MRLSLATASLAAVLPAAANSPNPTFYRDVLPVLQQHCQPCHRPGEAAPMAFLDFPQTRPWAKAIKAAVLSKKMPPWFASPAHGRFANDRTLPAPALDTLVRWADTGAQAGDPQDAPPARAFLDGWNIPRPDVVFEMPGEFEIPAKGTIDYHYVILPTGFQEDRWVRMAEVRPGNRQVVHHIIAFIREPGSKWLAGKPAGVPFVPEKQPAPDKNESRGSRTSEPEEEGFGGSQFLAGYAPGSPPEALPPGHAKLVKAGSDIVFQLHYTATGQPARDRSSVGLVFASEPVRQRVVTAAVQSTKFVIPPRAANHTVPARMTLHADSELLSLLPHMHLRGKSMVYRAFYPDGTVETILDVPRYDFNWQLRYELAEPKRLPKGTRLEVVGTFDNSANNPANPDPSQEVRWGEQSWEEMMMGFFDVAIAASRNPADLFRAPKKPASGPSGE